MTKAQYMRKYRRRGAALPRWLHVGASFISPKERGSLLLRLRVLENAANESAALEAAALAREERERRPQS